MRLFLFEHIVTTDIGKNRRICIQTMHLFYRNRPLPVCPSFDREPSISQLYRLILDNPTRLVTIYRQRMFCRKLVSDGNNNPSKARVYGRRLFLPLYLVNRGRYKRMSIGKPAPLHLRPLYKTTLHTSPQYHNRNRRRRILLLHIAHRLYSTRVCPNHRRLCICRMQ